MRKLPHNNLAFSPVNTRGYRQSWKGVSEQFQCIIQFSAVAILSRNELGFSIFPDTM